jgi:hypothetical protein
MWYTAGRSWSFLGIEGIRPPGDDLVQRILVRSTIGTQPTLVMLVIDSNFAEFRIGWKRLWSGKVLVVGNSFARKTAEVQLVGHP